MHYHKKYGHCIKEKISADLFEGELALVAKPLRGINPSVLLVGPDPIVGKKTD